MVHEQCAGCGRVLGWVKRAIERLQDVLDVFKQVADFARYGADKLGLIGRKIGEVLGALGMLDLVTLAGRSEMDASCKPTSLLPRSPYI